MDFRFEYENMLHILFFICFCAGVGYVGASMLFGKVCERLDACRMVLKPSLVAAFLMVFGGVGLIAQHRTDAVMSGVVAGLAASATTYLLYRYLIKA